MILILQHTDCLNPPEGGSLTYSSDFTNVATYQCNDGLQLTQLELSRACTATGWDKEDLSCSKCSDHGMMSYFDLL